MASVGIDAGLDRPAVLRIGFRAMNQDSGLYRGQAHIAGGRMSATCCLYMATIVAIRCDPAIRPFYKHPRELLEIVKAHVASRRSIRRRCTTLATAFSSWRGKVVSRRGDFRPALLGNGR